MTGLEALEKLREKIARAARDAILDFGKGDTVSTWYSPMVRKDMAAQLAERAINATADEAIAAERERFADAAEAIEGDARAVFDCLRYHASAGGEYEYRGTLAIEAFQRVVDKIPRTESAKPEPRCPGNECEHFACEECRSAKPEPGDVVAWPNPPHGHVMIGLYGRDWTSDIGLVVLMRAAEVKRRIEGEK